MDWLELFLPILQDVIITLVVLFVGFAVKLWRDWKLEAWIKDLALDAVLMVQERYWDQRGEDKFDAALAWIMERIEARKIPVDQDWLEALIDSIVFELRASFGEDAWYHKK